MGWHPCIVSVPPGLSEISPLLESPMMNQSTRSVVLTLQTFFLLFFFTAFILLLFRLLPQHTHVLTVTPAGLGSQNPGLPPTSTLFSRLLKCLTEVVQ